MKKTITFVFAFVGFALAVAEARNVERPRDRENREIVRPRSNNLDSAGNLNQGVKAQEAGARINDLSARDPQCGASCQQTAATVEGIVRDGRSRNLSEVEQTAANEIALEVEGRVSQGVPLDSALTQTLDSRGIDRNEFDQACK